MGGVIRTGLLRVGTAALLVVAGLGVTTSPAGARTFPNVKGKWHVTDQCPTGCEYTKYTGTVEIKKEHADGSFSGIENGGDITITGSVTLDGSITIHGAEIRPDPTYTETRTGNISGSTIEGSWIDSENHSGNFTAKKRHCVIPHIWCD